MGSLPLALRAWEVVVLARDDASASISFSGSSGILAERAFDRSTIRSISFFLEGGRGVLDVLLVADLVALRPERLDGVASTEPSFLLGAACCLLEAAALEEGSGVLTSALLKTLLSST